jgi:hypothetical protein
MTMFKKLAPFVLAAVAAIAMSTVSFAAPPTTPEKGKSAAAEKDKKPGKSCDSLSRTSDAYKDCVASKAHDGKTPGMKSKAKSTI